MTRSRKIRIRRFIEKILLLSGIVGLGIWTWSYVSETIYQDSANREFESELHDHETAIITPPAQASAPTPAQPRAMQPNAVVGRLRIPRLHLSTMIREGIDERTLSLAPGHIPGTASPGDRGNVGVAGHRDRLFRALKDIRNGDLIIFETLNGKFAYEVNKTEIVKPDNVSVLNADFYPELTLVTCYPFYYVGSAPDRFIVKARQISPATREEPPPQETVAKEIAPAAVTEPDGNNDSVRAPRTRVSSGTGRPEASGRDHGQVNFEVARNHSLKLAPGIYLGVTGTDVQEGRVDGWMWVMPDRRTIWLRDQTARKPVVFYSQEDGKKRELVITKVASNSIRGYLVLPASQRAQY